MDFSTQLESLRQSLSDDIVGHVTEVLRNLSSTERLNRPVLRLELFVEDADEQRNDDHRNHGDGVVHAARRPLVSRVFDLSGTRVPTVMTPPSMASSPGVIPEPVLPPLTPCASDSPTPCLGSQQENTRRRKGVGGLRPARHRAVVVEDVDSQRQMQVPARSFPKRAKVDDDAVAALQEASLGKFVAGIWEQIHGGVDLDPQSSLEQWLGAAAGSTGNAAVRASENTDRITPPGFGRLPGMAGPAEASGSFNRSNSFCRRVTQASRTCRALEVIVQARWVEHFESYVDMVASTNPSMSKKKCRKAALLEACQDFGWAEKDMRNRMRIWAGYNEIKDAGGWVALVFAGNGIYRLCKYRVGFDAESMQTLRALRPRIEVAADTLHPTWRQLLVVVGESPEPRFTGHPHDWVVSPCGSDPVPLRSTYLSRDPLFSFQHLDESILDASVWGDDDPRWVPPPPAGATACPKKTAFTCHSCGQAQSEFPKQNACYCFPPLFGAQKRAAVQAPVQVFRTSNGRNNGLQALAPFDRGTAIGEFVGLVTSGLQDVDVMSSSSTRAGGGNRTYQIWQGRQGNFTRFVNHSCNPNAQFQSIVWMGLERTVLVSKGISAGQEITVDYSDSYWRGLAKKCLCSESCCRYRTGGL
ncbi:histone-lysine N-methyltransferase [Chaetomidium leptoderma]|uniref:Histone-lysine N-methyltransferase n=1 Tax=Chaetomidium leptoderma TaxID=669021 RepID=A0AAN6ZW00_9PEZI|nr:histone-lysine N-methyltransferase [Chaetomidium leptoderma]